MSYDIYLCDRVSGEVLNLDAPHAIRGGTYQCGMCTEAWLNITYNYGAIFRRVMGDKGIRSIYGLSGAESIPVLESAIDQLSDDVSDDYWEATDGNAKRALLGLLAFARMRPDGVWEGD